jgi:hypothetical protein
MSDPTYHDHDFVPLDSLDSLDGPHDHIDAESIELEKIPRRLWEQTLAPLHRQTRAYIAGRVRDEHLQEAAWALAFELDMAECGRRDERLEARARAKKRTAAPLPSPDADHPVASRSVQLNIRLRADDHARLARAAQSVGMPPTTLARALVLNGAAQVLRDSGAT